MSASLFRAVAPVAGDHPVAWRTWSIQDRRSPVQRHIGAAVRHGVAGDDPPSSSTRRRPASGGDRLGRQVLLVDDDVGFVETFSVLLRRAGYTVIAEFTQAAALTYLSSHTPDALITDLRLGDDDGWSLTHFARKYQPSLPVIIVTGGWCEIAGDDCRSQVPIFLKPFEPDALLRYLESVCRH